jgi:hypothetical protein
MPVVASVVPPEREEPSIDLDGVYRRRSELEAPWTWRDVWDPEAGD